MTSPAGIAIDDMDVSSDHKLQKFTNSGELQSEVISEVS